MDKLRKVLGREEEASPSEEVGFASAIPSLGWGNRIKGFAICFVMGFIFSIIGSILLAIPGKGLVLFALFYTLGNIASMGSTLFLMGPWKQLKKMFNETRYIATIATILFMILTLLSGLLWKKFALTILMCIFQFLAMTWYSLSYIPYARDAVKKTAMTFIA